ncbi:uncharacterized protein F5891DRAFT_1204397 [Suillus fuscotomentosus]|uniref:Uncharacterized protein n=1 Tax=Suillus fuscotomentosus TaxID=1912939 RepID=A0AAD4DPH6_9AGAM|nr:uncharacterized protein F5891DRAFT_1204397 [Suillus fuscotomentosus]KAG1879008.1 hypothetical protein F5891DRAFT_1204397 [Suillus fuscotomentosus]
MSLIPADWALATTHIASDYVCCQFCAIVGVAPKILPPPELDVVLMLGCSHLARILADAYLNPVTINFDMTRYPKYCKSRREVLTPDVKNSSSPDTRRISEIILERPAVVLDKFGLIVLWYLPGAIDAAIQNDMISATMMMSGLLGKSITCGTSLKEKWHTDESNFQISEHGLTSGCINLSPCWFLQAHPAPQFQPEVSATLKCNNGVAYCRAMCRPVALVAAALRVMHSGLYWSSLTTQLGLGVWADTHQTQTMGTRLREWASVFTVVAVMCNQYTPLHQDALSRTQWFDIMTSVGGYTLARMKMPNIGIEIAYNPGVMAGTSGRIVRHGVNWVNGDQVGWVWYMRDDIHEFVDVPRELW